MSWLNNDSSTYKDEYGALYNWYCVNTGNLCPIGWHVPSHSEFTTLMNNVGSNGGMLKEIGILHWTASPNGGVSNLTGFTALPGGYRHNNNGGFGGLNDNGFFWSATNATTYDAQIFDLNSWNNAINIYVGNKRSGLSVRCIKD
jgi:uncharacterized protein (TIGR02145 family)